MLNAFRLISIICQLVLSSMVLTYVGHMIIKNKGFRPALEEIRHRLFD